MKLLLVLLLLALLVIVVVVALVRRGRHRVDFPSAEASKTTVVPPARDPTDMVCCGQHEVCERDSLLAALSRRPEYYDDEELDRFAHRPSDAYLPEEEEEFREVLYTMLESDVAGWMRSLQLRDIALPDGLRDEALLIVGERRAGSGHVAG